MEIVAVAGCVSFLPALKTFPDHHDHYEYHDLTIMTTMTIATMMSMATMRKLEVVHKKVGGCLISFNLQLASVRKLEAI